MLRDLPGKVQDGRFASFIFLLFVGGVVFLLLFSTVHRRETSKVLEKVPSRYQELITFWHDRGYLKHGGLWIRGSEHFLNWSPPKAGEEVKWAYKTSSMGYLQLGHVLERLHFLIKGRYSVMLMCIHNQALIWLASALLGWLAMRLSLQLRIRSFHALLLGVAVQIVFQTFPPNLSYYWEVYYSTVMPIFVLMFLLTSESFLSNGVPSTNALVLRGVSVFGMFYVDPATATFFVPTYLLVSAVLAYPVVKGQRLAATILLPAGIAVGIWMGQLLWVKLNFPGLRFIGSSILFRTGFDGSVQYAHSHADLFYLYRFNSGLKWISLFVAGTASLCLPLALYHKVCELRYPTFVLAALVGLYAPFAFTFSQGVAIHPYAYDTYLVIPLLLSLFCVLPATLERLTGNKGIFVHAFVLMAFCYSMVSLRTYAIDFPL